MIKFRSFHCCCVTKASVTRCPPSARTTQMWQAVPASRPVRREELFCCCPFRHGHLKACFFIHGQPSPVASKLYFHAWNWTAVLRSIYSCSLFDWELTPLVCTTTTFSLIDSWLLVLVQLSDAALTAVFCSNMSYLALTAVLCWNRSSLALTAVFCCIEDVPLFMPILDLNSKLTLLL